MSDDADDLAERWLSYIERRHPVTGDLKDLTGPDIDEYNEPVQSLLDLVTGDHRKAMRVVEHILRRTSDSWALENVGAGPLEDLLADGEDGLIAWVTGLPERFTNAAEALSHVWIEGLPTQSQVAVRKLVSG
jgi:hypothetical protein